MELDRTKVQAYAARLIRSRMELLHSHGFYGMLLMHLKISIDPELETAATDGEHIFFSPAFLDSITDSELRFILMHEVMHVVFDHVDRGREFDRELYNIAADIVVNSNILLENDMEETAITVGGSVSMHLTPDGREGHLFTAEKVYEMLMQKAKNSCGTAGGQAGAQSGSSAKGSGGSPGKSRGAFADDHSRWGQHGSGSVRHDVWVRRIIDAAKAIEIQKDAFGRGELPMFAQRLLKQLRSPQTDWRQVLDEFVQEEICDYSFAPPDRRFDGELFLPDFNVPEERVEDVLFMIDTSGSVSDSSMTAAFSEIKGALEQFGGRLRGWLGFFDAAVYEPQPFESVEELMEIKPLGGGGTSFHAVFSYVSEEMNEKLPSCIVILTDGYAPFPKEEEVPEVPVLWLMTTEVQPPFGRAVRIEV